MSFQIGLTKRNRPNPLKLWSKWLLVALKESSYLSRQSYSISGNGHNKHRVLEEVELIKIRKLDEKLSPIEIMLKYFCHTVEEALAWRRKPEQLKRMIGWQSEDGNVDDLIKDVIFSLEKEKAILEARRRKAMREHQHPRASLQTRL